MNEFINENKIIDQIRSLGIDMVHEAKSGHPGIVLGAAPIIYTLYAHHLRFDVENDKYFNRDRFVMSAGHGSALLYATLHMAGFDISLEDLKDFRKIDSKTPGHPELNETPGVDMTTGPLGQGIATAVGMAIAETVLAEKFNTPKNTVIDYNTYVLCGDGDLMEGISYEATSLAGTLKLNKLIVLYDSNNVCLDGNTSASFTEDITLRFKSINWNVITVENGEDVPSINEAISVAKTSDKPTLIEIKTTIGKHSTLEGTNKIHGSIISTEEVTHIKEKLKIRDIPFTVSQESLDDFRYLIENRCKNISHKFEKLIDALDDFGKEDLLNFIENKSDISIENFIYDAPSDNMESPRDTSKRVLNSLVKSNFSLIGGSADTFAAVKTYIEEAGDYSKTNRSGKNIFFGIREHAMGAIINGLSLCNFRSYASTFLTFSDYMKPAIRQAALMNLNNIYIFSHDSISVGEDGKTHQPIEQLPSFRAMPNIEVFRPADANEVIGTYKTIVEEVTSPAIIALSRNKLPILETARVKDVSKGGYVIYDPNRDLNGIIISSGEEVHLALEVAKRLQTKGIDVRVVSMPSLNRFLKQSEEYIEEVLPVEIRKITIETSPSISWNKLIFNDKYIISMDEYGASGNYKDIYKKYGFDVDSLEEKIENLLK